MPSPNSRPRFPGTPHPDIRMAIARAVRDGRHEDADNLRRELRTARLADRIREVVDAAPPLTDEQRAALAALLVNGSHHGDDAA